MNKKAKGIITRPFKVYKEPGGKISPDQIKDKLEKAGILTQIPVIKLEISSTPEDLPEVFDKSFLIILASPSGIYFFQNHLLKTLTLAEIQKRIKKRKVALLGRPSARLFKRLFVEGDNDMSNLIIPEKGKENAKELVKIILAKVERGEIRNAPQNKDGLIFVPKGDISSTNWPGLLSPLGIQVEERLTYRNVPARDNERELKKRMGTQTDWFFFSPSAVKALVSLTGAEPESEPWSAWCIGKTTEYAARELKFNKIITSKQAKEKILIAEYNSYLGNN